MAARRANVSFALVLASGVLAVACSTESSGPTGTGPCATSAECLNGYACIDGHCERVGDGGSALPDVGAPAPDTGIPLPPPPADGGLGLDAATPDAAVAPPIDSGSMTTDATSLPDAFDPDAPIRCGAMDQPCCGMICNAGLACVADLCRPRDACGGLDEPCCPMGCDTGLTCSEGTCRMCRMSTSSPGVSGMYVDSCGFVGCTAGLTITGSGTSITFSRGGGGPGGGGVSTGTLTLSGGVTASGTFTTTCPSSGACDLESVMGTAAGLVFTDRSGASGTIALTGATASGSVTFPDCAGDRCGRFFYVTGAGATMTFADATGTMGTITLTGAPVCEP